MFEFFTGLFDSSPFVRMQTVAGWTRNLIWLHTGSDVAISLACVLVPLVAFLLTRRQNLPPPPRVVWMFGLFLAMIGLTHFVMAIMFQAPVYRFAGTMKLLTAVAGWAAVITLIPAIPKAIAWWEACRALSQGSTITDPEPESDNRFLDYMVAGIAAGVAVLIRQVLDPLLAGDHAMVIPLVAVMLISWRSGFGPAILTMFLSMLGVLVLFVLPSEKRQIEAVSDQIVVGMFLFCGVVTAILGEAQRTGRKRVQQTLADLRTANEQLADSQRETAAALARLNAFIDNAPVGIAFFDEKLRSLKANLPLLQARNKPVANPMGRLPREVLPEFSDDLLAELEQAMAKNTPIASRIGEVPPRDNKGEPTVWLLSAFPIRHEYGFSLGLGVIARDITEQHRAQRQLQESEDRFRTLAEAMPQIVWTARPDGYLEYFNARWYEFTGLTPEESIGSDWKYPLHPGDSENTRVRWQHSLQTGDFYEIEYRLRGREGDYRWFIARATPVRNAAGQIIRWFGTCTDIDDFRRISDEAQTNAQRFRTLTESIPQLVWNTDSHGRPTYFNTRWREYTGLADLGRGDLSWKDIIHPDDLNTVGEAWGRVLRGLPEVSRLEIRVRRAEDGQFRWFQTAIEPLRRPDGSVDQWIGSLNDIDDQKREAERLEDRVREQTAVLRQTNETLQMEVSERQHAEEQVRSVAIELRRSNEELEQFAYVASHDLQEPLRKIQAFGDRLANKFREQVGEQGREYIDRMLNSAGRMRSLINDLLSFSRVSSKAHVFAPVDLGRVVREVLSDLEVRIGETGATVTPGLLPTIEADALQMRQLFQNLIANSLKFRKKDVAPRIEVTATPTGELPPNTDPPATVDGVRITLRDNGIGFDQSYAERIFEVFQRLHAKHEFEGTGIGLAVCRKIVERHGGTIVARSQPNEGAVFLIDMPVSQAKATRKVLP
ncbi:PAS domain S-box protein [Zavarzinella formosa]|uniref:PAS domain S-box protein n=1 Tax=Zavarzinella formosa TaxID=360055 RepID=UPI0003014B91|nr:PAS domain S-box protein [Zavarzinella formosa]